VKTVKQEFVKCLWKVSSAASLDRSATGKLFHMAGPLRQSSCRHSSN